MNLGPTLAHRNMRAVTLAERLRRKYPGYRWSQHKVSRIVRGHYKPKLVEVKQIADVIGVDWRVLGSSEDDE